MTAWALDLAPGKFLTTLQMLLAVRAGKLEFGHTLGALLPEYALKPAFPQRWSHPSSSFSSSFSFGAALWMGLNLRTAFEAQIITDKILIYVMSRGLQLSAKI